MAEVLPTEDLDKSGKPAAMGSFHTCTPVFKRVTINVQQDMHVKSCVNVCWVYPLESASKM